MDIVPKRASVHPIHCVEVWIAVVVSGFIRFCEVPFREVLFDENASLDDVACATGRRPKKWRSNG